LLLAVHFRPQRSAVYCMLINWERSSHSRASFFFFFFFLLLFRGAHGRYEEERVVRRRRRTLAALPRNILGRPARPACPAASAVRRNQSCLGQTAGVGGYQLQLRAVQALQVRQQRRPQLQVRVHHAHHRSLQPMNDQHNAIIFSSFFVMGRANTITTTRSTCYYCLYVCAWFRLQSKYMVLLSVCYSFFLKKMSVCYTAARHI
jgi:hypothetical protein